MNLSEAVIAIDGAVRVIRKKECESYDGPHVVLRGTCSNGGKWRLAVYQSPSESDALFIGEGDTPEMAVQEVVNQIRREVSGSLSDLSKVHESLHFLEVKQTVSDIPF